MILNSEFNASVADEFIRRLEKLTAESTPEWGKMSAAEMLFHGKKGLEVALGKRALKVPWCMKFFFKGVLKKAILTDKPFKQGERTAKEFHLHDKSLDFEQEKKQFIATLLDFSKTSDEQLNAVPHAIIGTFSANEWRYSQKKHLMHHWEQFNI